MRGVALTLAATGAAVALAGCGGDGRLSHDAFVERADAICSAYDANVKLITKPTSFAQVRAYVEKTLPLYVAALDKLKTLEPPRADEDAVAHWLQLNGVVVDRVEELRDAAMRHDLAATNDASTAVQAASLASRKAAADLGLQDCATP